MPTPNNMWRLSEPRIQPQRLLWNATILVAKVSLIHRGDALSEKIKYWIKPDIENRIKEGSITALFNTRVTAIESDRILLEEPKGPSTLKNDFVIAMTGYRPDFAFLKTLGIDLKR